MSDNTRLTQEQKQTQGQKLSQIVTQQQMLVSSLVELPITQLIDRIQTEMNDNPALEAEPSNEESDYTDYPEYPDDAESGDDIIAGSEREERQSAMEEALERMYRDDEDLPVYQGGSNVAEEREEMVYGETTSFYDQLEEQVRLSDLTERQRDIIEYLIGTLDDDGLLRKPLDVISDELAIYHNIDASVEEISGVLTILQDFDPAGIGACSLQECLLIQIDRREPSKVTMLMRKVIADHFEAFSKKHWDKIQQALSLSDLQAEALFRELRKLNPRPGASMSEAVGRSLQQITPDFIVDTQDDGTITFTLNHNEVPELKVSQSFVDSMNEYQQNKENMSNQTKETLLYIKKKVDAAQGFIEAVKMRRHTLTVTMQAIISKQRRFFQDGDEASLRPMNLKDVAEMTGLDMSTISRVSNSKFAQTRWGTFPLRYFFSDSYVTEDGEELSTRQIKAALKDIVEGENRLKPLSDDAIRKILTEKGFPIARRTVAKYRESLGIPIARLRK